jgi:spermidine dehydrogenase
MTSPTRSITRRDFLNATLLASGGALLDGVTPLQLLAGRRADWDGYGGVGDYARANGDTFEVLSEGHKIRDRVYARAPAKAIKDAGTFDCVVVGGGVSGLAAALFWKRRADTRRTCLVLDDHAIFGGMAKRNDFEVDGHHLVAAQGSALFFPPLPGTFLAEFYPSIGIDTDTFEYQAWAGARTELPLGKAPYFGGGPSSAYFFGPKFGQVPGLLLKDALARQLEGAPLPEATRRDLLAIHEGPRRVRPSEHGDAESRRLDGMTLEQHLMEVYGISRETVRGFLSPVAGGGSGIGADVLSAYADLAADVLIPWDYGKGVQMFPGGNTGVARHIVKTLLPDAIPGPDTRANVSRARADLRALDREGRPSRIRAGCTVISVAHIGRAAAAEGVEVVYSRGGRLFRVRARAVVMAGGSWTSRHLVRDLPSSHQEAYAQFQRAPALVASVAVRNWRFLADQGLHECRWFEGIANYISVCRVATFGPVSPTLSPDEPVVLTLKILFSHPGETLAAQVARGRAELLGTSFRDYERRILDQLTLVFGASGFDARRDVAGLILNRWGHAYLSPQPGFFFGSEGRPAPGEVLRHTPFGRIAFANSDVTGIMDHRASILEADRAVRQVVGL